MVTGEVEWLNQKNTRRLIVRNARQAGGTGGGTVRINPDLIARANNRSFTGDMGNSINRMYKHNVKELTKFANIRTKKGKIANESELAESIAELKVITENTLSSNMNYGQARKSINDYYKATRKKWNDRIVEKNTRRGSGDSTTY